MNNSQHKSYKDSKGNMFYLGILDGKDLERHEYQPRAIDHKRVKELKENIEDIDLKLQAMERQEKKLKDRLKESQEKFKELMPRKEEIGIGHGG